MNQEKDKRDRKPKPAAWKKIILAALLAAAIVAGYLLRGVFAPVPAGPAKAAAAGESGPAAGEAGVRTGAGAPAAPAKKKNTLWTCSMHPQIRLPKPGLCPICNMKLIPLETEEAGTAGPREIKLSENAVKLMEIETFPVERKFVEASVRMVGKIDYDETRLKYITAWIPGRLDRLFVDYTGVPVKKGDHMVSLYSPELLSAQEELIQALQAVKSLENSDSGIVRETTEATVEAAREKLRLWGLEPGQIEEIEKRGTATDHMTIYSPIGGIVIHKNAQEGMYVDTGTRIYTVADLSEVWVRLDAYESDLIWLRYGQRVEFTTEAYPGEVFEGTIAFIDPVLTMKTRTVKVRVNAENPRLKLKPGMFVRAEALAGVAEGGRVMDASLAGKWICPMHPGVVKDGAGSCDICGMPLVRTESLGYVGVEPGKEKKPLVIPATAALVTGTRAVVYVELPGRDKPAFEGREVVLGPRAGDYYVVRSGLKEGELVVTRGNFKIDAELQIRAKPSMMTPEGGGGGGGHRHGARAPGAKKPSSAAPGSSAPAKFSKARAGPAGVKAGAAVSADFRKELAAVVAGYLSVQKALAGDDAGAAAAGAKEALKALDGMDMSLLEGDAHTAWMGLAAELKKSFSGIAAKTGIAAVRETFALLSESMMAAVTRFGPLPGKGSLYQMKCPMAFDNRGATWLQTDDEVRNPYFGSVMLRCGEVIEVVPAEGESTEESEGRGGSGGAGSGGSGDE